MVDLYNDGNGYAKIARKMKIRWSTVRTILEEALGKQAIEAL